MDNKDDWRLESGEVAAVSFLADSSYYIINDSLKLTYEHHILIRRDSDQKYVFVRAEDIVIGDYLIKEDFSEEVISSAVYENSDVLSVCIDSEPFNMFIAGGGYIIHNEGISLVESNEASFAPSDFPSGTLDTANTSGTGLTFNTGSSGKTGGTGTGTGTGTNGGKTNGTTGGTGTGTTMPPTLTGTGKTSNTVIP
jgi:hypothetical protein